MGQRASECSYRSEVLEPPSILPQNLFDSDAYKKTWPELDNMGPVKDASLLTQLEAQLDAEFTSGQAQQRLTLLRIQDSKAAVSRIHSKDEAQGICAAWFAKGHQSTSTIPQG